ncbi:SDR family NAD(P)-dependent oxidoreductase [Paracraurococcus lichenis]|uniref:SDR family NAD(P)-dependent oxidoreductase n=1 Tax=Paracraurococcus lichenis TaxID=3064888 RepID=A0ABT9DSU1_9PROT|nr:SDR family NAD(P)-dependent oxidoreductase [Paracraurococcus sp. LOR1-02]MDO9706962.1 SDR family NAD(P)-dependent oxidoreductase [Paracraurococcus sp. LOR1-02]
MSATQTATGAPTWLMLGASSAVARAFAREAAAHGHGVLLAGRDMDDLERQAADLAIRYEVPAAPVSFDARDHAGHAAFARDCAARAGGPLNLFLAFGSMPDQAELDADPAAAAAMVDANFTGAATLLAAFAPVLEAQRQGMVVALGSVAGDRGRPRNYTYGATKAALHTFLQGYAARLSRVGVGVLCIRPGPVDTAMTWALPKLPFMASPRAFAAAAWKRARKGGGDAYLPGIWWPIMTIIRNIPTRIFNKLDL